MLMATSVWMLLNHTINLSVILEKIKANIIFMKKYDSYEWKIKDSSKRIIIAHDESTIGSGDVHFFKWLHHVTVLFSIKAMDCVA
jgi:hypothetical protein